MKEPKKVFVTEIADAELTPKQEAALTWLRENLDAFIKNYVQRLEYETGKKLENAVQATISVCFGFQKNVGNEAFVIIGRQDLDLSMTREFSATAKAYRNRKPSEPGEVIKDTLDTAQ